MFCYHEFGPQIAEAVLTSTHNLCFGAKIRKIGIPCIPQFYYIKVGFKGVFIARTCFPDVRDLDLSQTEGIGTFRNVCIDQANSVE